MKKTREEKAITLIALIITIVVLLILAVVAINAVTGDGIIQHAVNAKTSYENAQTEEQGMLSYYETYLQTEGKPGKWVQEGATLKTTNSDGTITQVKIGDYVNYIEGTHTHTPDISKGAGTSKTGESESGEYILGTSTISTEELTWRVLGINKKGELELISADPTTQTLFLANDEGYLNAEDNLNNFCNDLYGQGTNTEGKKVATGARSLNADDINKLTGYNPTSDASYGIKYIYRYPTQDEMDESTEVKDSTRYMQYSVDGGTTWSNITNSKYQTFRLPEDTIGIGSSSPGSKELTYKHYGYNIAENLTIEDGFKIEEATQIANMITNGTTSSNITQWLASRYISCGSKAAGFNVNVIYERLLSSVSLFLSIGKFYAKDSRVRPVVSLSSQVSLTETGENVGSSRVWNISL